MSNQATPATMKPTTHAMRLMLIAAALLVLIQGLPIYLFPHDTATLFSWTVNPPITVAFLGAGYLTSMFVEYLASRETTWANARIAVPAVMVFTTLTTIVTLRHLDKFHFGAEHGTYTRLVTWAWLVVYLVVPPLLAVIWWRQVKTPGTDEQRGPALPTPIRGVLAVQAFVATLVGLALYIAPEDTAPDLWPWKLSALTAGAVGAWLLGIGVGVWHVLWENDLRRVRPWMIAYLLFAVLQLVALVRLSGNETAEGLSVLDWGGPRIWIYAAAMASILIVSAWSLIQTPESA